MHAILCPRYSPISIHRYSGPEPFGKRGDDSIVLLRWERSRWLCVDMGQGRTKFPGAGGRVLYECPVDSLLPPDDGWIAVEGALPVFRIQGIDGLAEPTCAASPGILLQAPHPALIHPAQSVSALLCVRLL